MGFSSLAACGAPVGSAPVNLWVEQMSFLDACLDSFYLSGCCLDVPCAHLEDWWDRMLAHLVSLGPSRGCRLLGCGIRVVWWWGVWAGLPGVCGPSPGGLSFVFCFVAPSFCFFCPSFPSLLVVSLLLFFPPVSFSLFLPLFLLVVFRVVVVCLLASAFALPPCLPARASLCFFFASNLRIAAGFLA